MRSIFVLLLCFSWLLPVAQASAHGDHQDTAVPVSPSREAALKMLRDGVNYMEEALNEQNRESLFSDGPVMEKLHEKVVSMEDAIKTLSANLSDAPSTQRTALKRLPVIFTAYHEATHDKDAAKALAEVKKAQNALRVLEKTH